MKITTIGLDLAKNVFQVHGIDAAGKVVVRRALRRGQMLVTTRLSLNITNPPLQECRFVIIA